MFTITKINELNEVRDSFGEKHTKCTYELKDGNQALIIFRDYFKDGELEELVDSMNGKKKFPVVTNDSFKKGGDFFCKYPHCLSNYQEREIIMRNDYFNILLDMTKAAA